MATSTFNNIKGIDGRALSDKWASEGTRTFLGVHTRGYPNLFVITGPQGGGGSFNFTDTIDAHTEYVVWLLKTMRDRGIETVDVKESAEAEYAEHCRQADLRTAPLRDCLSYYNDDGKAEPGSLGYYGGAAWHRIRETAQDTLEPYEFTASTKRLPEGIAGGRAP